MKRCTKCGQLLGAADQDHETGSYYDVCEACRLAPITSSPRGLPIYVDRITDGDGVTRRLSRPVRLF